MGSLKDKVVGGKNSYSKSQGEYFNDDILSAVRKNTPYYYPNKDIIENTKSILNHFQQPLFPRTIYTFRTKGKQIIVYNLNQIIDEFAKSNFIDCRINAFSSVNPIPNFIMEVKLMMERLRETN
jgi:hypothetical protein